MTFVKSVNAIFSYFCTQFRRYQIYGNIQRNDGRTGSSVDFQLYFAFTARQSAATDLFIGRCSYRGALSGYQRLGFSRGKHFGRFSYSGILQWLLRRFRHSRGAKVRCAGLCHDAPLCGCQPAAGCGDVCCHCRGYQHLLCRYSAHDEYIFTGAYYYLLVTFIGVPFTFFYNLLSSIIRALGDSKTPFWFLLLSTVLNILLDLFYILVLGWGVAGAAIATVFSQGVSAILCYIYMMRRFDILKTTPAERKFDGALARTLMYIGVPMGLQFSITAIGSIMLQSANNALGTACVAAFTAAMRIKMFFMCPFESLGMAMATYSGQNYGAGKPERIWMGVKASALMMIVYWAFTFCVLMFGARTFALLFVDASELEILKNTELFLHISVSFFPVLGLLCILRYTIQGVGYTNLAMLSGVSEMIARILVSLLAVPAFGYLAVCFGDPTAWIFADAFLIPAFIYVYRRILRMKKN